MTTPTLLIIEDDAALRSLETRLARRVGFDVRTAPDGPSGLASVEQDPPDVIISDFHMPGMTGGDLLRRLRQVPALSDRPILVVTGDQSDQARHRVTAAGATGVILKPFQPAEFRAELDRVAREHGLSLEKRGRTRRRASKPVAEPAVAPAAPGLLTVMMAAALERPTRSEVERTRNHIRRIGSLAGILGRAVSAPSALVAELEQYAGLHDVGKAGLPDIILRKPDLYTSTERQEMETHVLIGADMLRDAGLPESAVRMARHHHERWDGTGYPGRLAGQRIPLEARIVATVDVYDALRSVRSYRSAIPADEVDPRFRQLAGTHLDPSLVDALLAEKDQVDAVFKEMGDPSDEPDVEVWR